MALADHKTRRDQLILDHIDVARGIARKMARRTRHLLSNDDIEAAAMLCLTEAQVRYRHWRAAPALGRRGRNACVAARFHGCRCAAPVATCRRPAGANS